MTLTYKGYYLQGRPDEIFKFIELDEKTEDEKTTQCEVEDED